MKEGCPDGAQGQPAGSGACDEAACAELTIHARHSGHAVKVGTAAAKSMRHARPRRCEPVDEAASLLNARRRTDEDSGHEHHRRKPKQICLPYVGSGYAQRECEEAYLKEQSVGESSAPPYRGIENVDPIAKGHGRHRAP